jgi:hypothetical protein
VGKVGQLAAENVLGSLGREEREVRRDEVPPWAVRKVLVVAGVSPCACVRACGCAGEGRSSEGGHVGGLGFGLVLYSLCAAYF